MLNLLDSTIRLQDMFVVCNNSLTCLPLPFCLPFLLSLCYSGLPVCLNSFVLLVMLSKSPFIRPSLEMSWTCAVHVLTKLFALDEIFSAPLDCLPVAMDEMQLCGFE